MVEMADNRISHFRKAQSLTQRALAAKVGTSQQQIQRIEAGVQSARLDLAAKIADALEVRLADVFPKLANEKKTRREKKNQSDISNKEKFVLAGIDPDPRHWTIRFFMFDGREFDFEISGQEKDRLESIVSSFDKNFIVFDSRNKRVAVNGGRIAACNIMFDLGVLEPTKEEEETFVMEVHLISTREPIKFGLEPDNVKPEHDDKGFNSQLQNLFFYLESAEEDETVWFDDADAERVYINVNHVLLLEVPLICCEPDLWEKSIDSDEDEGRQNQGIKNLAKDPEA